MSGSLTSADVSQQQKGKIVAERFTLSTENALINLVRRRLLKLVRQLLRSKCPINSQHLSLKMQHFLAKTPH